ncbi:MAG: hypothetical protein HQL46_02750 [Gammaproteobacteria bacterium]|nr:hypothetical protein [Gammaproteobacteria bacterium]
MCFIIWFKSGFGLVTDHEPLCELPQIPQTSNATFIGNGTPESCTTEAIQSAINNGGVFQFNCGTQAHTIKLNQTLVVSTLTDTLIDGGNLITLDGDSQHRIISMDTGNFENTAPTLTIKNLNFINGKSSGTSTSLGTHYDGGGGAIYYVGGNVQVFNSQFTNNSCDDLGPDLAGGAIFGNGRGETIVFESNFDGNHCANGGAIGNLWTSTRIYHSVIQNNQARGRGANYEEGVEIHGESGTQQGSGGNGGGIQMDGAENDMLLCNVKLLSNQGNALGGGIFRTTYNGTGTMNIFSSVIKDNRITDQPDFSAAGGLFFMGGPITIKNTLFLNNEANIFGAIQLENNHTVITIDNVDILNNTARTGLAAVWLGDNVSGTINNSLIAENSALSENGFAAAFAGNGIANVRLSNSKILNNQAGNGYNPISCWSQFIDGGNNYQWPVQRSGEGSDYPDALCTPQITIEDITLETQASEIKTSINRHNSNSQFNIILLRLNRHLQQDTSVYFETIDGTAIAGRDYVASSGTALIPSGSLATTIRIEILAVDNVSEDRSFYVRIYEPNGIQFPNGLTELTVSRTITN